MKTEKFWMLAALGITIVGIAFVGFYLHLSKPDTLRSGPGMMLPFDKVSYIGHSAILLSPHLYSESFEKPGVLVLRRLDGSYNNGWIWTGPDVEKRNVPLISDDWDGFIVVKPDNSAFYIGTKKQLIEFDNQLNVKRKIPISAFQFGSDNFEFGNSAVVSDERLWFTVGKVKILSKASKSHIPSLVEWCIADPPPTRIIGDMHMHYVEGMAVDPDNRRVFIPYPGMDVGIFDFSTQQCETCNYGNYDFIDFDKDQGLLLSNTTIQKYLEKPTIVKINLDSEEKQIVTEGLSAVWGLDGYVYFRDGYSELWRCRSDGSDRQPVYIAKSGEIQTHNYYCPPKVSSERELLAFNYSYDSVYGMVFLNLKSNEYIEVPGVIMNIGYNHMAWLIKNSGKTESLQKTLTKDR